MNTAIAIFVKTPGHSPIKTRLASGIGSAEAERWYRKSAQTTLAVVKQSMTRSDVVAYWAVAESAAVEDAAWSSLPRIAQPGGGLGARMAAVYASLLERHGAVMLIGADAPQLQANELARAAQWLSVRDEERFAIGPALDGGFWLFGGNRPLPLSAWTTPTYSRPDTATQFRCAVGQHGRWLDLVNLCDVDDSDDLLGVADALDALPDPLPEQRELATLSRSLRAELGVDA